MAEITTLQYQTAAKRVPYQEWFDSLTDKLLKAAVLARVNRLRLGTFGDWESVGDGVSELRIHTEQVTGSTSGAADKRW